MLFRSCGKPGRCADDVFPGGAVSYIGDLLSLYGGQHRCAQTPSAQQELLLQDQSFYFCFRDDLPHETECRRIKQYLYFEYDGAGNACRFVLPVYGKRCFFA